MEINTMKFEKIFERFGYKLTIQRQAVLKFILKNKDKHLSIEEIFNDVKNRNPQIGLATIYRTMQLFEEIGIAHHIFLEDGCVRYQMTNPEEKHEHHHLICEICGDVIDVEKDMLEFVEKKVFLENGFTVTNHKVQFFGICKKCLNTLKSEEN